MIRGGHAMDSFLFRVYDRLESMILCFGVPMQQADMWLGCTVDESRI